MTENNFTSRTKIVEEQDEDCDMVAVFLNGDLPVYKN